MNESEFVNYVKQDMIDSINTVNLENITEIRVLINKQLDIIESLKDIKTQKEQLYKEIPTEQKETIKDDETDIVSLESAPPIKENNTTYEEVRKSYLFERRIRGGFLPEISGFVPEGVVRKLGLENGDLVFANKLDNTTADFNHFIYELAEKGKREDDSTRTQLNYCPVKKEAGRLVVEKSSETGDYIRYNEGLYTVIIDEKDVTHFELSEGDLIDIAYPTDNIQIAKVLWKHSIEKEQLTAEVNTVKNKKGSSKKKSVNVEKTLSNKSILVVGNEPKTSDYKASIEERGGIFLWGDAKDSIHHLETKVKKSDVVLFLLSVSGHVGMKHVKRLCKEYGTKFIPIWGTGTTSLVTAVEEVVV